LRDALRELQKRQRRLGEGVADLVHRGEEHARRLVEERREELHDRAQVGAQRGVHLVRLARRGREEQRVRLDDGGVPLEELGVLGVHLALERQKELLDRLFVFTPVRDVDVLHRHGQHARGFAGAHVRLELAREEVLGLAKHAVGPGVPVHARDGAHGEEQRAEDPERYQRDQNDGPRAVLCRTSTAAEPRRVLAPAYRRGGPYFS
jgi:hypothetical protein